MAEYRTNRYVGLMKRANLAGAASLLTIAALMGGAAGAQPTSDAPEQIADNQSEQANQPSDILIVTGTRIRRTEFALPVPAQTLDSSQIELSGANELGEALVELPAITAAITPETSQSSTQSSGSSTISLRNLGSTRTLTLIDGRRTVGNTSTGSTVSISTIPDAFVERVEVITGGASALYGSDAVTGVVNVIMRDEFEGVQFETRAGTSDEGGNTEYGFEFLAGGAFDNNRGNVIFAFEYDQEKPIRENQRRTAMIAQELDENLNADPDELVPNRSSNIPGGLFAGNDGTAADPSRDTSFWYFDDGGTGALIGGDDSFDTDVNGFNFLGPETISIPRERFLAAGKFNYDLADSVEFFGSLQYSHVRTKSERVADTANSSRLAADFPIYLNDGVTPHPFVPQEIFDDALELGRTDVFFRRRWIENGNRFRESDNDTLRLWTGIKGEFWDNWAYEANFGYGEWRRAQSRVGDLVIPNYQAAIDVEFIDAMDPSQGLQCADDFARSAGCVPLNPFRLGSVTEDQVDWIILRDQLRARNQTTTASAWATGDLFDLWAGPVSVAFGYDFRQERSRTRWDPISTSGGGTVTQQVNQDGEQSVHEGYIETIIPLATDLPFAESLAIEGAFRVSDYSTIGSVISFKAGGTWQPIEDIRFRGVFARANRAPNNIELFSQGLGSQGGLNDLCDGVTASSVGTFDDTCRQDPIVAALISANGSFVDEGLQVQQPSFGNGELTEETANTITAGGVLTPRFAPGLQVAVDYYNIKIDGAISEIDASDILSLCYGSGDFAGTGSCAIPIRDAVSGQLVEVRETSLNVDELRTEGIDVSLYYEFEPAATGIPGLSDIAGEIDFSATYSRVLKLDEEAPIPGTEDTFVTESAGLLGTPEGRGRFSVNWENGPLRLGWRTVLVGSMLNDEDDRSRLEACRENNNCGDKIALFLDRELFHNFRVSYDLPDFIGSEATIFAGINNVTNNFGPILYGFGNNVGENHHSLYDITGRYYYGGVRLRF